MAANPLLLQSIALLGASALAIGVVALVAFGLWRAMGDARPLFLSELIAFEGIDLDEQVRGAGAHQFALAARKCLQCAERARCESWLARKLPGGYESFCPNAAYIARLKT